MSATKTLLKVTAAVFVMVAGGLAALASWRPGLDPYAAHRPAPQAAEPGAVTVRWFGVTAALLSDGQHTIFIDPFFTRPPGLLNMMLNREIAADEDLIAAWLRRIGVQQLDAVLVSHSHFDHGMDAGVVTRQTGATLLGSVSTLNIGRGAGVAEAQLRAITAGQPLQVGAFTITFIESRHAGATGGTPTGDIRVPLVQPARYLDYKLGGAYSILIQHPRGSVLHHGSAGYVPGALKSYRADAVLLGVALIDDLDDYLREVVDAVGARRLIPTHWDDFTRPLDQPLRPFPVTVRLDRFFSHLQTRPDLQVQTLALGEPLQLY